MRPWRNNEFIKLVPGGSDAGNLLFGITCITEAKLCLIFLSGILIRRHDQKRNKFCIRIERFGTFLEEIESLIPKSMLDHTTPLYNLKGTADSAA